MDTKHILSFSGGKDSTQLLIELVNRNYQLDVVVCNRMKWEEPELHKHMDRCDEWLFSKTGMRINFISNDKDIEPFMSGVTTRGKYKGIVRGFPLKHAGFCWISRDWKIRPLEKWTKQYATENNCKVHTYMGFAIDEKSHKRQAVIKNFLSDEQSFIKEKSESFPLASLGLTEKMCLELIIKKGLFCKTHTDYNRSGCWFCQKASVESRLKVITRSKERVETIARWCSMTGREIYPDLTIKEIEKHYNRR